MHAQRTQRGHPVRRLIEFGYFDSRLSSGNKGPRTGCSRQGRNRRRTRADANRVSATSTESSAANSGYCTNMRSSQDMIVSCDTWSADFDRQPSSSHWAMKRLRSPGAITQRDSVTSVGAATMQDSKYEARKSNSSCGERGGLTEARQSRLLKHWNRAPRASREAAENQRLTRAAETGCFFGHPSASRNADRTSVVSITTRWPLRGPPPCARRGAAAGARTAMATPA